MSERKLVTFREVQAICPIEGADMIELACIDGWQCVTKKGEFQVGNIAAYFEVDSLLPIHPNYEFLRKSSYKKMGDGAEGFRLKSIRLKGELSQGLLLPLAFLGLTGNEDENNLAELLGVIKYEPPISAELSGIAKGNFPSFIPKTDQERVQNLTGKLWGTGKTITYFDADGTEVVKEIPAAVNRKYEISEKTDGSSCTLYQKDGVFGVCSRNLDLVEDDTNSFWKIANKYNIKEKLRGINVALQGELAGESIQGNPYKLRGQELYLFDIYDIDLARYLSPQERTDFVANHIPEIKTVPILARDFDLPDTLDELLAFVQGKSALNPTQEREGLVFKEEGVGRVRFSFKGISNKYLLKAKD